MPNRLIYESIGTSESVAKMSDFQFRLWVGLIVTADDFGNGDARPAVIKGRVFPLRDRVTIKDIDTALHGLAAIGCVSLYTVGGKPYYTFPAWADYQRIRNKLHKFPTPDEADAIAADCGELPQIAADCGELPPEYNPKQSEYESESENKNAQARDLFAEWYTKYPKKVDKDKARRAWDKLKVTEELFTAIMQGLERWLKEWDDPKFIPYPAVWLNNRRWEFEFPRAKQKNKALAYEQSEISKTDFDALVVDLND